MDRMAPASCPYKSRIRVGVAVQNGSLYDGYRPPTDDRVRGVEQG